MTETPPPTAADQVAFLGQIERLLSEGQFVATYKYALLVAIADLSVQHGRDDGSELERHRGTPTACDTPPISVGASR
jgi:hypothetical protein